jgi:hypothetical protein
MSKDASERTVTLTDRDGCNFVQVSRNQHEIDREVNGPSTMDFLNEQQNSGGYTVDIQTGQAHGNAMVESDGRASLAPGQIETRSLTGLPRGGDASRLDPAQALVNVAGIEMTLAAAINAGIAQVVGGQVRERHVEAAPTKTAPIRGANLGDKWEQRRQTGNPDAQFCSVMAAASRGVEGAEMDSVLRRFDEALGLGLRTSKDVGEVYNEGLKRLKSSMAGTLEKAMPSLKGEGLEILEHYLDKLDADTSTSICQRGLYGENSWISQLKGIIEKDIRQAVFFKKDIQPTKK